MFCQQMASVVLFGVLYIGLFGLVNNAGVSGKVGPTDWMSLQDYHDVMKVNLYGMIDVTSTFMPLVKKERGRIVNTGQEKSSCGFRDHLMITKFIGQLHELVVIILSRPTTS